MSAATDVRDGTLILRLEAPLMSFGGQMVDQIGPTRRFPGIALITGLLGNALGYDRRDGDRLERLQARLRFASMLLRRGEELRDYQIVDLGQRHLVEDAWTTSGRVERRAGSQAARGTHIRERFYRADSTILVALRLEPAEEMPTIDEITGALRYPERPLFIGRKNCLPSEPVLVGQVPTGDLYQALEQAMALPELAAVVERANREARRLQRDAVEAELPAVTDGVGTERLTDVRDWYHRIHGGERRVERRWLPLTLNTQKAETP